MKTLIYILTLTSLWAASVVPLTAQPNGQDSTALQRVYPDSLRVTVDPGVFRWSKMSYEAEVRVSALYPPETVAHAPDSLRVLIDLESQGATFWAQAPNDKKKYVKADCLVLRKKNQMSAKGLVSWISGNPVKVTAKFNGISETDEAIVFIPMLLFILCLAGGAVGGWIRRMGHSQSVVDVPVRILSEKWSQRLEPLREIFVGMIAGILLYLLNIVSPLYLEFRPTLGTDWLELAQPLVIGFIGGWGGISLLVNMLQWISKKQVAPAAVEPASTQKSGRK